MATKNDFLGMLKKTGSVVSRSLFPGISAGKDILSSAFKTPTPTTPAVKAPASIVPTYPTPTGKPITPSTSINQSATTPKVAPSPAKDQYASMIKNTYTAPTQTLGTTATAPITTTAPTPTTTQTAPVGPTARDTAFQNYLGTLKQSTAEKEAKAKEAEARAKYLDFISSAESGIAGLEGQGRGIPLSIVRGQQSKLGQQAEITAKRLQGDIGLAQDMFTSAQQEREGLSAAEKAQYDYETELAAGEKPIEVGGVLYQKQSDGSYKPITEKAAEGFTLGKDQVRYDALGNVIAGGSTSTTDSTGANPTVDAYVKGIQAGTFKISDVPESLQNAVAISLTTTPKPQSEISKQVGSVIDELLTSPGLPLITGLIEGGLKLGNLDPRPEAQLARNKYNQLKGLLSLKNINYLKGTGAISDAEQRLLANAATALGRNLEDADFVAELQKLKAGLQAVSGEGASAGIAPDEEAFLRAQGYSQQEIDSLKGSVGNTSASIPASSRLASVNNNPGNLRFAGQPGAVQGEGGFARFPTVEAGVKALENQIKLDASRGLTLAQFINKYAPPSENDTAKYISDVMRIVGKSQNTPLASIDIKSLTKAIAQKESGTKIG